MHVQEMVSRLLSLCCFSSCPGPMEGAALGLTSRAAKKHAPSVGTHLGVSLMPGDSGQVL